MGNRHFSETPHEEESDEGANGVTDDYRRPGKTDRKTAAKKQAGTNCAADGDHRELRRGQSALQSFFAFLDNIEVFSIHQFCRAIMVNKRVTGTLPGRLRQRRLA